LTHAAHKENFLQQFCRIELLNQRNATSRPAVD